MIKNDGAAMNREGIRLFRPREVTGRVVLGLLLAFFAVVIGANAVMIRLATSTFGGVETGSSYQAGLVFKHELAASHEQDERGWQVSGRVTRRGQRATLEIEARDSNGNPLSGLRARVRLIHPADARRDQVVEVAEAGIGIYRGSTDADAGQWTVEIDLNRRDERLFRSRTKIILR